MLIGSPMCTSFSTWMVLNEALTKDHATVRAAKEKAIEHINFVVSLYQMQVDGGRYFLHEHPAYATSWQLEAIKTLLAVPSVQRVVADQCQFGSQVQRGMHKGKPVKKPSGFMTNSSCVARILSVRCTGQQGLCSRQEG